LEAHTANIIDNSFTKKKILGSIPKNYVLRFNNVGELTLLPI